MAEHVGAGGKPVQEDDRGRAGVTRFAEKEPMAVDGRVAVMNSRHDRSSCNRDIFWDV